jgi:CRP-like cAMP-binding protein
MEALRQVPLFSNLDEKDLDQLSRQMHERRFPEGAEVTTEGATGAGFFVIAEGNADVSIGGEHRATLGPGDHFGEVALIDDGVRSASITAATDLLCYGLTPWEFRPFVEDHPQVAWALLETLARRSRQAD